MARHKLRPVHRVLRPSLAGHTAEQVHQQVRSPLAQMPAYPVEQLPDDELMAIADYIACR